MASRAKAAVLALALAAPLAPRAARADGWSFGAGVASMNVRSAQLEGGGRSATGWRLDLGYRVWDRLAWEIAVSSPGDLDTEPTPSISYPADRAEFSVLELGARLELVPLSRSRVSPWVQLGLGYAYLNWQTYFYQQGGVGLALSAGLDLRVAGGLVARAGLSHLGAKASDTYGEPSPGMRATSLFLGLGWQFGLPPAAGGAASPAP